MAGPGLRCSPSAALGLAVVGGAEPGPALGRAQTPGFPAQPATPVRQVPGRAEAAARERAGAETRQGAPEGGGHLILP